MPKIFSYAALEPEDDKVATPEKVNIEALDGSCNWQKCKAFCMAETTREADGQRQTQVDFEDAIEDYVYVRTDPTDHDVRAKRQTREDAFPEDDDQETTKTKDSGTISRTNNNNEIEYFYLEITDSSQTSFELRNLKPFSTYQIFLSACREKTDLKTNGKFCGPEVQTTTKTMAKAGNDDITVFDAASVEPNQSPLGAIRVSWLPPPNPNGMILSYHIRHRKNEANQESSKDQSWESVCIPNRGLESSTFYVIRVHI